MFEMCLYVIRRAVHVSKNLLYITILHICPQQQNMKQDFEEDWSQHLVVKLPNVWIPVNFVNWRENAKTGKVVSEIHLKPVIKKYLAPL
jgi:hypothetical protein